MSSPCPNDGNDRRAALHAHRMQKCVVCNFLTWSKLIKQTLTGLRKIEIFIYVGGMVTIPAPDAPWIARLLEMQYGTNGLREFKIKVLPGPFWMVAANPPDGYLASVARLDSLLQSMIKKGAENHRNIEQGFS